MDVALNAEAERREDKTPSDASNFWGAQLALADRDQKDWADDARKIHERYRAEQRRQAVSSNRRFNILYSNTEVLKASLYAQAPKPDIRRRFTQRDPVGMHAAEVIERALDYCADLYDVDKPIQSALHDHLLDGRGVVRVCYEPSIKDRPVFDPLTGTVKYSEEDDQKPITEQYVSDQTVYLEYVYWDDYRQAPARQWKDVWWLAYRKLMTREGLEELVEKAPQGSKVTNRVKSIPLNWQPTRDNNKEIQEHFKKAEVWEIWDKRKKQRVYFVAGFDELVRVDDDPYQLEGFYPQDEPLRAIEDTETLVPTPEFNQYRGKADDLDEISVRINRLTRALKRRGVYNAAIDELKRLATGGDNQFIPVENYAALMQNGGLVGQFQTEDISMVAEVLVRLYEQHDRLIQQIYEITGIADIMRGSTDPNETLGAQKLKAQFGSSRLQRRQRSIQKWIRNTYRIKAELIAEHFEPDVLTKMTQIPVDQQLLQILRSDKLRGYRIDIETDSTIARDAAEEKKETVEMLTGTAGFLEKIVILKDKAPEFLPIAFEMLATGLRVFKEGRKIEELIDTASQMAAQQAQQPQPKPEQQKMMMEGQKVQADIVGKQMDQKMAIEKHQMEMQGKAADLQIAEVKAQAEMQKEAMSLQADQQRHQMMHEQALQRAAMPPISRRPQ